MFIQLYCMNLTTLCSYIALFGKHLNNQFDQSMNSNLEHFQIFQDCEVPEQ